ncbi:unnamed protein product [Chrysodeixis includens]|uniref:G-protein coupled receptors family 1 profile domain-containing protein n=1 Tax=Chrysodeixis includens TaxID=689277 RepID=A0A9P0C4B4_CHRIL|nr:unnamed protein product [Chrysodeixis includens]
MTLVNSSSSANVTQVRYGSDAELAAVHLFQNYSDSLLCFATVCCVIYTVIGIPGNLTTIVALARCRKLRNATAIFIINLHICEVLFCVLVLPITAITFAQKHWTHGVVVCRLYPLVKYSLNAVSILTILAIAINRYVIVCHPLRYPKIYKRRNLSIMLLAIWISAFGLFMPTGFGVYGRFELEPEGGFCTMLRDSENRSPKTLILWFSFVLPFMVIVFCYSRIWWVVRQTAKKSQIARPTHLPIGDDQQNVSGNRKPYVSFDISISTNSSTEEGSSCTVTPTEEGERAVVRIFKAPFRLTRKGVRPKVPTRKDKKLRTVIAAIMISYCVTHMPIMITRLAYKTYKMDPIANIFAHLLEYSASCINPLIYGLMSREYRQAYKNLFECMLNKILRR